MKLPGLVRLLAEDDERGEPAIAHIARVIREAGHLPTTKRGRGASDMGVLEAANLLIAAHATDVPNKVSETVETFRKLHPLPTRERHGMHLSRSPWWSRLAQSSFGDALESLFAQSDADRSGLCKIYYDYTGETTQSEYIIFRSVRFSWPEPAATISLTFASVRDATERPRPDYDLNGPRIEMQFGLTEADRLFLKDQKPPGRIHEVTVRDSVIRRLSEACAAASAEASDKEAVA